jgi:DNA-binding MurR/RpiR family transcriptional regulator
MQSEKQNRSASRDDAHHVSRREIIRQDIAKRLRRVCTHLSDEEFAKLVEAMADQKIRGERSRLW